MLVASLSTYKTQATDTSLDLDLLLVQRWQELTLEKKAKLIIGLSQGCRQLVLIGVQQQYQNATLNEICIEYSRRCLGGDSVNLINLSQTIKPENMIGNPLTLALEIAEILQSLDIDYLVGGSVASSLLGEPRATLDLDLVVDLKKTQVNDFLEQVQTRFYINTDTILEAIKQESSFNLINLETTEKIDIFILKKEPYSQQEMQRRQRLIINKNPEQFLYFPTAEDVILKKIIWYRLGATQSDRQWRDILGVIKVQSDKLDLRYLQHWATELKLSNLLMRSLLESGYSTE